jgi:hypothetical protein
MPTEMKKPAITIRMFWFHCIENTIKNEIAPNETPIAAAVMRTFCICCLTNFISYSTWYDGLLI